MRIIVRDDYDDVSRTACQLVVSKILSRPDLVLGLATGATQVGLYRCLVERYRAGCLDLSRVRTFNLDEYYPVGRDCPGSFYSFMRTYLWGLVNLRAENTHIPDGTSPDPGRECREYEEAIAGCRGIDLQVLGIGVNGHIGFNEPGSAMASLTHVIELAPETIQASAAVFGGADLVPRHAITMGIRTIMQARSILLLASGERKAEALASALTGPVDCRVPASALQLHPLLTVVSDRSAAQMLPDSLSGHSAGVRASSQGSISEGGAHR